MKAIGLDLAGRKEIVRHVVEALVIASIMGGFAWVQNGVSHVNDHHHDPPVAPVIVPRPESR